MTRHPRTVMPDESESLLAQAAFWRWCAACALFWSVVGFLGWCIA